MTDTVAVDLHTQYVKHFFQYIKIFFKKYTGQEICFNIENISLKRTQVLLFQSVT